MFLVILVFSTHSMGSMCLGINLHFEAFLVVEKREWEIIYNLTKILEQQEGSAEKKLERMGDIIYNYGEKCFGVNKGKQ